MAAVARLRCDGRGLAAAALLVTLAGCTSGGEVPQIERRAGLGCVDDSRQCIEQRQAALRTMMSDRERRWVREPVTPEAYASGVRLFASPSVFSAR